MYCYKEIKELFEGSQWISPIDFQVAETIAAHFHADLPLQKLWLALLFASERRGYYYFNTELLFQMEYTCEVTKSALSALKDLLLGFDISLLSPFTQSAFPPFEKPVIQIGHYFVFQKTFSITTEWITTLKKHLSRFKSQLDPSSAIENTRLTQEQKDAVDGFFKSQCLILTGGPGRGKTFTAVEMVKSFTKLYPDAKVIAAAPTGKAVEHLFSKIKAKLPSLDIQAFTLHALLKITPQSLAVESDEKIIADLLIVDECSMIDFGLFDLLLKMLHPGTKLLFLGDANQLPPIDGPSPFSLLIEMKNFDPALKVFELKKALRTESQDILAFLDEILEKKQDAVLQRLKTPPKFDSACSRKRV